MSIASLKDVLTLANQENYAVAGFVVLGWEDARAYVQAAEVVGSAVIIQAGPGCRENTPIPVLAKMFRYLAETASVPVVTHLDHGYKVDEIFQAIDCGFSSVMFDGSKLPIEENVEITQKIVARAKPDGVSVEGEVGFVGYAEGAPSAGTDPQEARLFATQSGADAMAISIGNVHLHQTKETIIDMQRLELIEAVTDIPLVLHGGSGIPTDVRRKLASQSNIAKFNIGTEVRMAFGQGLREVLDKDKALFDRVKILTSAERSVYCAAREAIENLLPNYQTI